MMEPTQKFKAYGIIVEDNLKAVFLDEYTAQQQLIAYWSHCKGACVIKLENEHVREEGI